MYVYVYIYVYLKECIPRVYHITHGLQPKTTHASMVCRSSTLNCYTFCIMFALATGVAVLNFSVANATSAGRDRRCSCAAVVP